VLAGPPTLVAELWPARHGVWLRDAAPDQLLDLTQFARDAARRAVNAAGITGWPWDRWIGRVATNSGPWVRIDSYTRIETSRVSKRHDLFEAWKAQLPLRRSLKFVRTPAAARSHSAVSQPHQLTNRRRRGNERLSLTDQRPR
jgi:hypothetical protein